MFNIVLTVVIFHSLSALALFIVFALSSRANAVRDAEKARASEQGCNPHYSHG